MLKDYCSGRSSNTKPSCNVTELNRNSKTERRWNKKEVSLSSPELRKILRPRSERNWRASLFMGPRDSKAIGWKQYWLSSSPYLVLLLVVLLLLLLLLLLYDTRVMNMVVLTTEASSGSSSGSSSRAAVHRRSAATPTIQSRQRLRSTTNTRRTTINEDWCLLSWPQPLVTWKKIRLGSLTEL